MDKTCFSLFFPKNFHFFVFSTSISRCFRLFCAFSMKLESWSRFLAFLAGFWPPKLDDQPQLSYFTRYAQIIGTDEFPLTKISLLGLFRVIFGPMGPFLGRKRYFRLFFDICDIGSKYTFGHCICYIRGRNDFNPPRVVYFFTGSTMVVFILLYLGKWRCYRRFFPIFNPKTW